MIKTAKRIGLPVVAAMYGVAAQAVTNDPPSAAALVDTATDTFYAVGAVVAAAVGFFIVIKIVKWIKK